MKLNATQVVIRYYDYMAILAQPKKRIKSIFCIVLFGYCVGQICVGQIQGLQWRTHQLKSWARENARGEG
jgi:hypothetical protein